MTPNPLNLSVKALRTWSTEDGGGYQFTLTRDGKPVAFVHQGGYGGPVEFQWSDPQAEKDVAALIPTLPPIDMIEFGITDDKRYMPQSLDCYIAEILGNFEYEKKLAAARKKAVLFRLTTDSPEAYRPLKYKDGSVDVERAKAYLDKKYGPTGYVLV